MLLFQLSPSHSIHIMGHTAFGVLQSHLIPPLSSHGRRGLLFHLVLHLMTWSTLNLWWAWNLVTCVMTGNQIDEFTPILLAEPFVAQSHIYHGFMGKMSKLTHFQLHLVCKDYSFLTRQIRISNMVLILSSKTPKTHQNWINPLMRLTPCLLQFLRVFCTWLVLSHKL